MPRRLGATTSSRPSSFSTRQVSRSSRRAFSAASSPCTSRMRSKVRSGKGSASSSAVQVRFGAPSGQRARAHLGRRQRDAARRLLPPQPQIGRGVADAEHRLAVPATATARQPLAQQPRGHRAARGARRNRRRAVRIGRTCAQYSTTALLRGRLPARRPMMLACDRHDSHRARRPHPVRQLRLAAARRGERRRRPSSIRPTRTPIIAAHRGGRRPARPDPADPPPRRSHRRHRRGARALRRQGRRRAADAHRLPKLDQAVREGDTVALGNAAAR